MTNADDPLPRRFRSFVARSMPAAPETAAPAIDDLPTLTEIVAAADAPLAENTIDPAALRAALQESLQESLSRWLDETLPQVLEKLEHGTRQKL